MTRLLDPCSIALAVAVLAIPARAQEAPAPESDLRLIPGDLGAEGDERPLEQLQLEYIRRALVGEAKALQLEASLLAADPGRDKERETRVDTDRRNLDLLMTQALQNVAATNITFRPLSPLDRFLYEFAKEQLRLRTYSPAGLAKWIDANASFEASSTLADRDLALAQRERAYDSMGKSATLQAILVATRLGTMTDEDRQTFITDLRAQFADAPLPALQLAEEQKPDLAASTDAPVPEGAEPVLTRSGAPDLPALDGAESVLRQIPSLSALYKAPASAAGPKAAGAGGGASAAGLGPFGGKLPGGAAKKQPWPKAKPGGPAGKPGKPGGGR